MNGETPTMKQIENYKLKYVPQSYLEARDTPDTCWKHPQKRSQSFPVARSSKNPESVMSYYSASTTYKPQRNTYPMYSKYTSPHDPDVSHMHCHSKATRDKYSNSPTTRKAHFDDELGNIEKIKYEELENFTEDNGEEDVEEEITEEDREEPVEFLDKDYEEQEADDEIDDESDPSPQTHRPSRSKNEVLLKQQQQQQQQQRWRAMEQKLRCQQHMIMQTHPSSARYYHSVAEHEIPEPLSEEEFVRTSARSPTRRKNTDYHNWSSSRNDHDQYNDFAIETPRRARTKPDVDRLLDTELNRSRKCNRCGSLSAKKVESPKGCRFDDRANIPTKGPIGDEPDEMYCGRCNLRYNTKDALDVPTSMFAAKPRRSREVKSPTIYEVPEQAQDKISRDYARTSPPRYQRKSAEPYPERAKRSLHTSQGTARIQSRYVE